MDRDYHTYWRLRDLHARTSAYSTWLYILSGCAGNTNAPVTSNSEGCSAFQITGTMQDSLTNKPVAQGVASLELGSQITPGSVYTFSQSAVAVTDSQGAFTLCASTKGTPSVLVLLGSDSSNNNYPPLVLQFTGPITLGHIPMGICRGLCGLPGEQQTAPPATINGTITSSPSAVSGSVMAQFAIPSLDGSQSVWSIAVPALKYNSSNRFATGSGTCLSGSLCTTYKLSVPSQEPIHVVNNQYVQGNEAPIYTVSAVLDSSVSCSLQYASAALQQDGKSLLVAVPNANIPAAPITFGSCQ